MSFFLHPNALEVARKYIGPAFDLEPLGWGMDGVVYPSPQASTAVKIYTHEEKFAKELAAYHRLGEHDVASYMGFAVPRMVSFDRKLRVIEMSIVRVPYLLDFAAAELDFPKDFSEDAETDWWDRVRHDFGDDFEIAQDVYWGLVNELGLYYYDLKPRNLAFR